MELDFVPQDEKGKFTKYSFIKVKLSESSSP